MCPRFFSNLKDIATALVAQVHVAAGLDRIRCRLLVGLHVLVSGDETQTKLYFGTTEQR